jgi:hypothetical protein
MSTQAEPAEGRAVERPHVRVVLRTGGRPIFLARALASVASQTYDDWDLVVVATESAADVERTIAASSPVLGGRVQVRRVAAGDLPSKEVSGAGAGYLAVLDDDTTWHPDFLARTLCHLDARPSLVAVLTAWQEWTERLDDDVVDVETGAAAPARPLDLVHALLGFDAAPTAALLLRIPAGLEDGAAPGSLRHRVWLLAAGSTGRIDEVLARRHRSYEQGRPVAPSPGAGLADDALVGLWRQVLDADEVTSGLALVLLDELGQVRAEHDALARRWDEQRRGLEDLRDRWAAQDQLLHDVLHRLDRLDGAIAAVRDDTFRIRRNWALLGRPLVPARRLRQRWVAARAAHKG